jgi:hypothetical protein
MFSQKVNAILAAIRSRAAAYAAAADAIELAAREAETARVQAGDRIAAAVASVVNPSDYGDSIGHDALFTGCLDTAVEALGCEPAPVAETPAVEEKAAKPARARVRKPARKVETTDTFPTDFVAALAATGTVNALVVPSSSGSRVVADDGTVYDRAGGPDFLADLISAAGLTVYRTYDAWDARQPS